MFTVDRGVAEAGVEEAAVAGVGLGGSSGAVDGEGGVEGDGVRVNSNSAPLQPDRAVVAVLQHNQKLSTGACVSCSSPLTIIRCHCTKHGKKTTSRLEGSGTTERRGSPPLLSHRSHPVTRHGADGGGGGVVGHLGSQYYGKVAQHCIKIANCKNYEDLDLENVPPFRLTVSLVKPHTWVVRACSF